MCREHLVFKLGPVAGDDVGARALAPLGVGHSDDCGFGHQGVRADGVLNLDCRNVLASGDDDVFRAVLEMLKSINSTRLDLSFLVARLQLR